MNPPENHYDVAIVGAGFTGLSAAYELVNAGAKVIVLEADRHVGGLAGTFEVHGQQLERFYHHWFTNDRHITELIGELELDDHLVLRPTRTGIYHAHDFFKLSTPMDLLKFTPLPLIDRIRLGLLTLRARRVKDWKQLEDLTAEQWLRRIGGNRVYETVWEPLLCGKFGPYASEVSAVWFWNKLKLRGGSRGKSGKEMLAYFKGGFAALAEHIADHLRARGGEVRLNSPVNKLLVAGGKVQGVQTDGDASPVSADRVLLTTALPIVADLVQPHVSSDYIQQLNRIEYLANICLVLELDRSLSQTYWLNVADPNFPYVGIIEHTNFQPPEWYGGSHIVYLSKYLAQSAELYNLPDPQVLDFSIPHIQRMFPEFSRDWVRDYHVWRARYAQPIVVRHYSRLIPDADMPIAGLHLATMAQVYPEDRGTNYAVCEGRAIGRRLAALLARRQAP